MEEAETSAAVPAARADESVGHPADAQPAPPEATNDERAEQALAAGHAAGLADIRRGTPAYTAARVAAGVHPDSQYDDEWLAGYNDGQDELARRCQDAEARGQSVARQGGGAGHYAAVLVELTGSAVESGPIAEAYKRGYTSGKSRRQSVAYRCRETGQTWTGRGLKPRWLLDALADGKTLDDFLAGS